MSTYNNSTLEDDFRLWAFAMYYKAYKEELDLAKRFVRTLVEASKPVATEMIEAWLAARREIRQIDYARTAKEITREEWAAQIHAAILSHTGVEVRDRGWVGEPVEEDSPCT